MKELLAYVVTFCLIHISSCKSHEDDLRKRLLTDYNPDSLPMRTTEVKVRFKVLHYDMNEKMQCMDLDMWISMEWMDPRLKWNTGTYKIAKLAIPARSVWRPDFYLFNNAQIEDFETNPKTKVLDMNGKIIWIPPVHLKSMCVIDTTYWPNDIHNCTAKFGSWMHTGQTIDYKLIDDMVLFDTPSLNNTNNEVVNRGEWEVVSSSVVRKAKSHGDLGEEINILVSLVVQRNAPAYKWLIIVPSIVLCFLSVVIFILPPSASEKIFLSGISLILNFFFLFFVSQLIGHSPNHTPMIVEMLSRQLILTCGSVVFSAIILRMIRDPHVSGLYYRSPLIFLGNCLCLRGYKQMVKPSLPMYTRTPKGDDLELNSEGSNGGTNIHAIHYKNEENDWLLFAAVLDRLCFIFFLLMFIVQLVWFHPVLF